MLGACIALCSVWHQPMLDRHWPEPATIQVSWEREIHREVPIVNPLHELSDLGGVLPGKTAWLNGRQLDPEFARLVAQGPPSQNQKVRHHLLRGALVGGLSGAAGGAIAGRTAGDGGAEILQGALFFGGLGTASGAVTGFTMAKTRDRVRAVLMGALVNTAVWIVSGALIGSRTDDPEFGATVLAGWGLLHGVGTSLVVALR